jgi:hypothetical protein
MLSRLQQIDYGHEPLPRRSTWRYFHRQTPPGRPFCQFSTKLSLSASQCTRSGQIYPNWRGDPGALPPPWATGPRRGPSERAALLQSPSAKICVICGETSRNPTPVRYAHSRHRVRVGGGQTPGPCPRQAATDSWHRSIPVTLRCRDCWVYGRRHAHAPRRFLLE